MPDIAASNVAVTVEHRQIEGKKRRNRIKIAFGDGSLTYPSGGVPMPGFEKFGMKRNIDFLILTDAANGNGLVWKYDQTNRKLRGYWAFGGAGSAPVAAATPPEVSVPSGATTMTSSAAQPNLTEAPGHMREFVGGTTTIAAQTLYAEAVGW